jgi:hypothetical protein
MKQTCVSQPTTVELLDALEAGIGALRDRQASTEMPSTPIRRNILNGLPQAMDTHRIHPFSRIEEL